MEDTDGSEAELERKLVVGDGKHRVNYTAMAGKFATAV